MQVLPGFVILIVSLISDVHNMVWFEPYYCKAVLAKFDVTIVFDNNKKM